MHFFNHLSAVRSSGLSERCVRITDRQAILVLVPVFLEAISAGTRLISMPLCMEHHLGHRTHRGGNNLLLSHSRQLAINFVRLIVSFVYDWTCHSSPLTHTSSVTAFLSDSQLYLSMVPFVVTGFVLIYGLILYQRGKHMYGPMGSSVSPISIHVCWRKRTSAEVKALLECSTRTQLWRTTHMSLHWHSRSSRHYGSEGRTYHQHGAYCKSNSSS